MTEYNYESDYDENNDLPYVEIELDIKDCHQIYKALVYHFEKGTFGDEYEKKRTDACKDFFYRMILEYKYKVE